MINKSVQFNVSGWLCFVVIDPLLSREAAQVCNAGLVLALQGACLVGQREQDSSSITVTLSVAVVSYRDVVVFVDFNYTEEGRNGCPFFPFLPWVKLMQAEVSKTHDVIQVQSSNIRLIWKLLYSAKTKMPQKGSSSCFHQCLEATS